MDKVTKSIAATKKMGFDFNQPDAPDIMDHFDDDKFELTVE